MPGPTLTDALLYGRTDGLPPELLFLFARTGLVHCFSASGFHMAAALVIARGSAQILSAPWRSPFARPALTLLCSLALMFFFGTQTSWSSPMVRAFTFAGLLTTARSLELRPGRTHVFLLSLAAAALLGQGSWLSFFLSGLGMAGLLLVRPQRGPALLLAPWAVSLPLTLWHFQLFSLSAPFWNLTVGAAMSALVLPPAIAGLLLRAAGLPSAFAFSLSERAMELCVRALEEGDAWLGLAYWAEPKRFLLVSALLLSALAAGRKRPRRAFALAISGVVIAWLYPSPYLAVLNVGQGDAIFLRTASGERLLVDDGPPPYLSHTARAPRALEALGVGPLDHLLLTHLDRDHVGGTADLLQRHPLRGGLWLRKSQLGDEPRAFAVLAAAERARVPIRFLERAAPPNFRCWLPPAPGGNDSSSFCFAELPEGRSIWLTGDAGYSAERWLLDKGPLPRGTFLKVAHHGSRFSGAPEFLARLGAGFALVSVGARNRYGHPAPEALSRLRAAGLEVHRTDREGTLLFYGAPKKRAHPEQTGEPFVRALASLSGWRCCGRRFESSPARSRSAGDGSAPSAESRR